MGNGGEMAFYAGFNARDVFRGVATLGAALGNPPKDNVANQPLAFFISAGDKTRCSRTSSRARACWLRSGSRWCSAR
jgi:predicted esterase